MKRPLSGLLLACLLWTQGPLPQVFAQTVGMGSFGAGTPAARASAPVGVFPVSPVPLGPSLSSLSPAGLAGPAALPSFAKPPTAQAASAAGARSAPALLSAPSAAARAAQAVLLIEGNRISLPVHQETDSQAKNTPDAPRSAAAGRDLESIAGELEREAKLGLDSSPSGGLFFDGLPRVAGSLPVPVTQAGTRLSGGGLSKQGKIAGSEDAPGGPASPKPAEKSAKGLPVSYHLYLAAQFLYALGQEATSLIAPLYAYSAQGLAFAVASQASFLLAILPGSFLGEKWVKRFDAKKVYLAGNLLHGLFALSVPVLHALTGAFSPVHFLASNLLAGFVYGALRGVAEKEIAPRILGQEDRERLDKAGSLFYAAFEGAELTAALVIAGLIPLLGLNPAAAVMSALMLASAVPIWFMKLKREKSEGGKETGGTEKSLPKMLYLPYIFTVFSHLSLYMFLAPFLALEVFRQPSLNGTLVAFYTAGSLLVALATAYAPKLAGKLSERGWAAAGIASMLAFLAASLLLQSVPLSMAAALLLGVGLTGMQIQWRSLYQQRLAIEVQPTVFKWLSVLSVTLALPPFVFMQAGLVLGWSMPALLMALGAVIAAVSLGVPLFSWLRKHLRRGPVS